MTVTGIGNTSHQPSELKNARRPAPHRAVGLGDVRTGPFQVSARLPEGVERPGEIRLELPRADRVRLHLLSLVDRRNNEVGVTDERLDEPDDEQDHAEGERAREGDGDGVGDAVVQVHGLPPSRLILSLPRGRGGSYVNTDSHAACWSRGSRRLTSSYHLSESSLLSLLA